MHSASIPSKSRKGQHGLARKGVAVGSGPSVPARATATRRNPKRFISDIAESNEVNPYLIFMILFLCVHVLFADVFVVPSSRPFPTSPLSHLQNHRGVLAEEHVKTGGRTFRSQRHVLHLEELGSLPLNNIGICLRYDSLLAFSSTCKALCSKSVDDGSSSDLGEQNFRAVCTQRAREWVGIDLQWENTILKHNWMHRWSSRLAQEVTSGGLKEWESVHAAISETGSLLCAASSSCSSASRACSLSSAFRSPVLALHPLCEQRKK